MFFDLRKCHIFADVEPLKSSFWQFWFFVFEFCFEVIKNLKFLTIENLSLIFLICNIISTYKESVLRMRNHLNTPIILRNAKLWKSYLDYEPYYHLKRKWKQRQRALQIQILICRFWVNNFRKFSRNPIPTALGWIFSSFLSFDSKKSDYKTVILFSETKWGKWNCQKCSNSCGGGTQVCTRECENGEPGDSGCEGPSTKPFDCNEHSCPGKKLIQIQNWIVQSD